MNLDDGRAGRQAARARCRQRIAVVMTSVATGVLVAACAGDPPLAKVDGGTPEVALTGDVVVPANGGDVVTITHASPPSDGEPVTHAFVGGTRGNLPPIFMPADDGLSPNPGVWGSCRGGDVAAAAQGCPMPPVEGPAAWNGSDYWSTGAILPSESREVPLDDAIPAGDYALVCALHPELRVLVRVDGQATKSSVHDLKVAVNDALVAADAAASNQQHLEVLAGVTVHDSYVARFVPETVTVPVGGTVTWRAGARTPVDVVFGIDPRDLSLAHTQPTDANASGNADGWGGRGVVQSGFLSKDPNAGVRAQSWSVTFMRPGTYEYGSRFGPSLRGTVVVTDD